jgi:MoaA/NifB/PqqE/SkfB family radical SAM enzyme
MDLIRTVKRYSTAVSVFKAYTYLDLLKQVFTIPFDMYMRDGKSSMPLNIALFVTLKCNARCSICNLEEILNDSRISDMPIHKIEELIHQVKRFKPSIILFGGEPALRGDLARIIGMFKRSGMSVGMFTNGTALNEKKIQEYVDRGLDYIVFSLLGTREVHDRVLKIEGAYNKAVGNLRLFIRNRKNTSVIVHSTITFENIDSLSDLIDELTPLGLSGLRIGHPTFFTGIDIENHYAVSRKLFPDEAIRPLAQKVEIPPDFAEKVVGLYRRHKDDVLFTPDLSEKGIRNWYSHRFSIERKCLFVYRGMFILPNGDVLPCESLNWKMGNIFTSNLLDIWNNNKYKKLRKNLKKGLLPACARCCKL